MPLFSRQSRKSDKDYYDDNDSYYGNTYQNDPIDQNEKEDDAMNFVETPGKNVEAPKSASAAKAFGGINEAAVSLKVMAPKDFAEATKVADSLIEGSTVVLNVEALGRDDMVRFMDFLMGVLYVINGNMKSVSATTVVVSPASIGSDDGSENEEKAE